MLGKIFGSNSRVKIMKYFLLNPEKSAYIRQLARDLNLQLNSVRRELENLEKFGLLVSGSGAEMVDNKGVTGIENSSDPANIKKTKVDKSEMSAKFEKKFFRVNKDFVLFEEIKSLIIKAQVLYERDFVDKIKKTGKIRLLILSGFFVNNQNSPVDILIVGHLNKDKFVKMISDLEIELSREINYTILEPKEFRYRMDMTDKFLINIIEAKKLVIVNDILS